MSVNLKGKAAQVGNVSLGTNGDDVNLAATMLGQLFTADWRTNLLLAGRVYRASVGTLAADADLVYITGGGAGTVVELEQPELIVGVDSGYYLIPMEVEVACLPLDLATEINARAHILITADTSVGIPTSATATTETPQNMLDGGAAFPGRCFSAVTADIADPGTEQILACVTETYAEIGTNAGPLVKSLNMTYKPVIPSLLAGPCSFSVYWGGTAAVGGVCSAIFAAVPSSWFPTS